jgi:hypothetical protein
MPLSVQQLAENIERICRGENCPSCGAPWANHEMVHLDDCEHLRSLDEHETAVLAGEEAES